MAAALWAGFAVGVLLGAWWQFGLPIWLVAVLAGLAGIIAAELEG